MLPGLMRTHSSRVGVCWLRASAACCPGQPSSFTLHKSASFSAKAESKRRDVRRIRYRQALKEGQVALQSRRIASRRIGNYLKQMPTWQDILHTHSIQGGSFDGYCYSNAIYRISQKPFAQWARTDTRYSQLLQSTLDAMNKAEDTSKEDFDASLLSLLVCGIGLTTNAAPSATFVGATPLLDNSNSPLTDNSVEPQLVSAEMEQLLTRAIDIFSSRMDDGSLRQHYWLRPHHLASLIYGLGHTFLNGKNFRNSPVFNLSDRFLPSIFDKLYLQMNDLTPFDISRTVAGLAMLEVEIPDFLLNNMFAKLNNKRDEMRSLDWVCALWGMATMKIGGMLPDDSLGMMNEALANTNGTLMAHRWHLRPQDIGTVAWAAAKLDNSCTSLIDSLVDVANHPSWEHAIVQQNRQALEDAIALTSSTKTLFASADNYDPVGTSHWAAVGSFRIS